MKKVTFLTGSIPPKTGGELYNLKLYSYLEQAGLDVEAINLYKIRYLFKLSWIPLVGIVAVNICLSVLAISRGERLLVFDQYFGKYLVGVNVIHRYIHRGKILAIVHHFDRYESSAPSSIWKTYCWLSERKNLVWANHIITNSKYCQQELISLGFQKDAISILPPGVERKNDRATGRHRANKHEEVSILCVGHCIPRKGIMELVKAFSTMKDCQQHTLNLVGSTDKDKTYYRAIRTLVDREQLGQSVIFHGRTDDDTLEHLYQQADVFVLPSHKEGFGIVLLEAMYYGLPIISTKISAIPELVRDGETGLLVPPGNPKALAEALSLLIDRPDFRSELGNASRQQLLANYSWEKTGSKFTDIIKSFTVAV